MALVAFSLLAGTLVEMMAFKCSGLKPEGPGAEPDLKLLIALATCWVEKRIGGAGGGSFGGGEGGA